MYTFSFPTYQSTRSSLGLAASKSFLSPNTSLSLPYEGTDQTVANMIKLAKDAQGDIRLRQFLEKLCRNLRPKDYLSEYAAVFYWSMANLRYMRDPRNVELVRHPASIIRRFKVGGFDCDDISTFLAACLSSLGGNCRIITVGFKGNGSLTHVLSAVEHPKFNGKYVILDPVAGGHVATRNMLKRVTNAVVYEMA